MSIWDHIKPQKAKPTPTSIEVSPDKRAVTVVWDDGVTTRFTGQTLRQMCPCAACVDEWTNTRRHDPSKVPATTTIQDTQAVGNYALSFLFSDNHATGIFTWEVLRGIADQSKANA